MHTSLEPRRLLSRSNRGVPALSYESERMINILSGTPKHMMTPNIKEKEAKMQNDTEQLKENRLDSDSNANLNDSHSSNEPHTRILAEADVNKQKSGKSSRRKRTQTEHDHTEDKNEAAAMHQDGSGEDLTKKERQAERAKPKKRRKMSSSTTSDASSSDLSPASSSTASSSSSSSSSSVSSTSSSVLDSALLKVRDRLTAGLLKAIRKEGHGMAPHGRKPYAAYETGMTEEMALRLMSGYDAYLKSRSKKLIRWLFFDVQTILQLLGCSAVIDHASYSGIVRVRTAAEAHVEVQAEFEALEVRFDQERELIIFTSRTRLHSAGTILANWPASKQVFPASQQK